MIQQWIDNGCDYQEGIKLYEYYNIDSVFLGRFKTRQNTFLYEKMKSDLKNILNQTNENLQVEYVQDKTPVNTKPLEFYPLELHEVYHDRISSHIQARALKLELNKLSYGDASEALPIILKIDKLIYKNEKCWKILRHFEDTKQILPYKSNSNFKNLAPLELMRLLQNKESSASKLNKNINRWEIDLNNYDKIKRFKKEQDILNKKEKLQIILNDIQELKSIIYNE